MDLFCFSPWKRDDTFLPFIWEGKKIMYIMSIPGPDLVLKIQYLLLSSLKKQ